MTAPRPRSDAPVGALDVAAYRLATDAPEGDGTLAWDSTTAVVVHASGGGRTGVRGAPGSTATSPGRRSPAPSWPRRTCATWSRSTTTSASSSGCSNGALDPKGGRVRPHPDATGLGVTLRVTEVHDLRVA